MITNGDGRVIGDGLRKCTTASRRLGASPRRDWQQVYTAVIIGRSTSDEAFHPDGGRLFIPPGARLDSRAGNEPPPRRCSTHHTTTGPDESRMMNALSFPHQITGWYLTQARRRRSSAAGTRPPCPGGPAVDGWVRRAARQCRSRIRVLRPPFPPPCP